jgi:hypothetical protein
MQTKRLAAPTRAHQSKAEQIRQDARRFVDALAIRLGELEGMATLAKQYDVFNTDEYAQFKQLFLNFSDLCEEFQLLSHLTEESLANFERAAVGHWDEHRKLEEYFRKLQVPMLHAVIRTNLRLLRVWDDRLQRGEGLPYGAREVFLETIRVIHNARSELLRPRYVALLDEAALEDADRADRLLRTLISQAPQLFDFAATASHLPNLLAAYDNDLDTVVLTPLPASSQLSAFA